MSANLDKALIVFSGGMDSTTLLAREVIEKGVNNVEAINFVYGSKHNDRERESARKIAKYYGIKLTEVDMDFVGKLFKSDLLKSGGAIPEGHYEDESMKATVVPFRNGIMIAIATGYAESIGAGGVYLGSHAGDHAIYPDCRMSFNVPMMNAVVAGTDGAVQVFMPFSRNSKSDLVTFAMEYKAPLGLSYSCYNGRDAHCGLCGTCVERLEAFALAGVYDPAAYEDGNAYASQYALVEGELMHYPEMPASYDDEHAVDEKKATDQEFH